MVVVVVVGSSSSNNNSNSHLDRKISLLSVNGRVPSFLFQRLSFWFSGSVQFC